jgi:hypothetical protein
MEYLKIKNWSKFQHYKLRNPPWIKLHRTLVADYKFTQLSDTDKCHLILIWLEGSNHDGAVPNDPDFLRRRLGTKRNPDLKLFIEQGWLIKSASTNSLHQTEESREEKKREETSKAVDKYQMHPRACKAPRCLVAALAGSDYCYIHAPLVMNP